MAAVAILVALGAGLGGALMGALLTSSAAKRAAARELREKDSHQLVERVRELELFRARQEGIEAARSRRRRAEYERTHKP